jgi:hypothetical protein
MTKVLDEQPMLQNTLEESVSDDSVSTCFDVSDAYSPFTGKGYNPLVKKLPWKGFMENLRLKEEHGAIW